MNVAFIHFYTFRMLRGIETLIISLSNELVNKGIDVSILSAQGSLEQTLVPVDPRVKVKRFPTFRFFEHHTIAPFYIYDLIKNNYDIVNIFFADFGEVTALRTALKFTDFRVNLYLCYPLDSVPHRFKSIKESGLDRKADVVIADSHYVAEGAQKFFQRPCVVIPVGTDVRRFSIDVKKRRNVRDEIGIADDEIVLLNVSELEERKGTLRVIEALPSIRAVIPRVRYLILGRGNFRSTLESRVEQLGLADCVHFMGTTTDLASYYNAADIFVMLPDYEANSIACHEAMSCGLPVIVSSSGGFKEVVTADCGRLVDIEDRQAIVTAVLELAQDLDLRKRLGQTGRTLIQNKLTWDRIADQLVRVFEEELASVRVNPPIPPASRKRSILFIEPFLFRFARGIERFTQDLANNLVKRGFNVSILCWKVNPKYHLTKLDPHVRVVEVPTFRYYAAVTAIAFYLIHLLRNQYDVVNIFFAGYGESEAISLGKLFGLKSKINVIFHYPYVQVPHRYQEFSRYGFLPRTDILIATSKFVQRWIDKALKQESMVITSGVDCEKFKKRDTRNKGAKPILITLAALEERKGIQHVIRALPEVLCKYPETTYIVLGEGAYRPVLEQLARDLGVSDRIFLLGAKSDVAPFLNEADIFLLLSYGEASPLTPIEAMACELPVIVAKQEPFNEIIEPAYGIMVDETNSSDVSSAIIGLLGNEELRAAMGKAGRKRVVEQFSWEKIADAYSKLFEQQLSRTGMVQGTSNA